MATADDVREIATGLPRTIERLVRDRVKFNVGRIVYVALSRDEQVMGCGFPKEERDAVIAAEPDKFSMPGKGDQRYHWIVVELRNVTRDELRELVTDAWRMCAPKTVVREYDARHASPSR
ncbi:MmcQ/YjbR family DNA-binding protein [Actinophytocola sp.]|uniref:MmcQ/YjbR family DNA-binding protein n=1 Tax=Actinophytocola sp. TaxID=1872138 RepID=UPI003899B9F6